MESAADVLTGGILFGLSCLAIKRFSSNFLQATGIRSLPVGLIGGGVLLWSCIVGCATILGIAGLLQSGRLLAMVAAGLLAAEISWRRQGRRSTQRPAHAILFPEPFRLVRVPVMVVWLAIAAILLTHLLVNGLHVHPLQWDSLSYHLPRAPQWLQTQSLSGYENLKWYYPGSNELLLLWVTGGLSGDFFYALNNLLPACLLALSVFVLARRCGSSAGISHGVSAFCLLTFIAMHQLVSCKNDLGVAALATAYLVLLMELKRRPGLALSCVAGMALGLLAGVKYYALVIAGGFWILTVIVILFGGGRVRWRHLGVLSVMAISLGGFWYGRNWQLRGTPLFPKTIFSQGEATDSAALWSTSLAGHPQLAVWDMWLEAVFRMLGPGLFASVILLPAVVMYVLHSRWRHHWHLRGVGGNRGLLLLAILGSGGLYLVSPFTVETPQGSLNFLRHGYVTVRLGLTFFVLSGVLTASVVSDFVKLIRRRASRLGNRLRDRRAGDLCTAAVMVLALIAFGMLDASRGWRAVFFHGESTGMLVGSTMVIFVILIIGATWWTRVRRGSLRASSTLLLAAMILLGMGLAKTSGDHWHRDFAEFYDDPFDTTVFSWIESAEDNPLLAGRWLAIGHRTYPLAGSRRERLLVQIEDIPVRPFPICNPAELRQFIKDRQIRILVAATRSPFWRRIGMDQWADQHPEMLKPLFRDESFHVYAVQPTL